MLFSSTCSLFLGSRRSLPSASSHYDPDEITNSSFTATFRSSGYDSVCAGAGKKINGCHHQTRTLSVVCVVDGINGVHCLYVLDYRPLATTACTLLPKTMHMLYMYSMYSLWQKMAAKMMMPF